MNKKETAKKHQKNLNLDRETLGRIDDLALKSIAGGCGGMPRTCTCFDF